MRIPCGFRAASHLEMDGRAKIPASGMEPACDGALAIKIILDDDVRRFTVPPRTSFAELQQQIISRFELAERVRLRYKDDESEMCTIASDDELREAMRLAALATPPILRILIVLPVVAAARPAEPRSSAENGIGTVALRNNAHGIADSELPQERREVPSKANAVLCCL